MEYKYNKLMLNNIIFMVSLDFQTKKDLDFVFN